MKRCLLLFSGGLDSILATKILMEQKIKVVPVCFSSYFFGCDLAKKSVKQLKLRLRVVDFSKKQLKVVKKPRYGHGKGLNPCIDCHLLMIKEAKKIMKKGDFNFLATGEVLGERPFSQRKEVMKLIEKKANLEGLILRSLSAKLLKETIPEKKGWVEREKLFAISGKSRKPQLALAKKFKIKEFPSPSGGCILTDSQYTDKLRVFSRKNLNFNGNDTRVLRKGRVFWERKFLIIAGRNENENKELIKMKKKKDVILEPENFPGPTVLIRGFGERIQKKVIMEATEFLLNYSKKIPEETVIEVK